MVYNDIPVGQDYLDAESYFPQGKKKKNPWDPPEVAPLGMPLPPPDVIDRFPNDTPTGGGNGGEGGGGDESPPFPLRPPYKITDAPKFNAPKFDYQGRPIPEFNPQTQWKPLTLGEFAVDPSYEWRKSQGLGAMQNSKAARGLSRTGGTQKAYGAYASDLASQEFGNVDARRYRDYLAQYGQEQDQYAAKIGEYGLDFGGYDTKFNANYTGARDEYAPLFSTWQTRMAAEMRAKDIELQNMIDMWKRNHMSDLERAQTTPGHD